MFTAETERNFAYAPLPTSCSCGEKSSGVFSATPADTTSHVVMSETIAALSPKLCDPSSWRETSVAPTTPSTLPSSCWTGTSSGTSARKRKTSEDPCCNLPTALPIPSATGPSCASWATRGQIPHPISQSPLTEKPTPTSTANTKWIPHMCRST